VPARTEAVPESTAATLVSMPTSESGSTLASQAGPEPTSGLPSAPERAASLRLEPTQAAPRVTPSEVLWAMLVGTVFATILVFFGTRIRSRNPSAGRPRRFPS